MLPDLIALVVEKQRVVERQHHVLVKRLARQPSQALVTSVVKPAAHGVEVHGLGDDLGVIVQLERFCIHRLLKRPHPGILEQLSQCFFAESFPTPLELHHHRQESSRLGLFLKAGNRVKGQTGRNER